MVQHIITDYFSDLCCRCVLCFASGVHFCKSIVYVDGCWSRKRWGGLRSPTLYLWRWMASAGGGRWERPPLHGRSPVDCPPTHHPITSPLGKPEGRCGEERNIDKWIQFWGIKWRQQQCRKKAFATSQRSFFWFAILVQILKVMMNKSNILYK